MKVILEGQAVTFDDNQGNVITITTEQLFEMLRFFKIAFTEDGISVFGVLELTV